MARCKSCGQVCGGARRGTIIRVKETGVLGVVREVTPAGFVEFVSLEDAEADCCSIEEIEIVHGVFRVTSVEAL